jgi:DNA repair protein RecO (recombination protein O)
MAYTQVVYYYKPTRDLQILSESSHVESFHHLRRSLQTITIGLRIVELVDALTEEEDPQPDVFGLTVRALRRLDRTEARAANLWPYVQLRLAGLLGIAPSIDRANVEAVDEEGLLSRGDGGVYPADATPEAPLRASRAALRAYAVFARADLDTVMRMELKPPVRREVETLVRDFLRYHVEDAYPNRSQAVIAQLEHLPAEAHASSSPD